MVREDPSPNTQEWTHRRVLVVEDDEGLNNLAQKTLREAGFDTEGVFTGTAAVERIRADRTLTMLLDNVLPDMTGAEVIAALNELDCTVPFVVMTGHGDENVAVEMMKLGARDYLVKDLDVIKRLPGTFRHLFNELGGEWRLAAAQEALYRSEQKLESMFEHSATAMVVVDRSGRYVQVNQTLCKVLGYSREELLELSVSDTTVPGDPTQASDFVSQLWAGELTGHRLQKSYFHKDGHVILGDVSLTPIHDREGRVEHILAELLDITERKRTEDELARQQRSVMLNHQIANVFLTSPPEEIYDEVLAVLLEALGSRFGYFGYINDDGDLVCPSMTDGVWDQRRVADKDHVFPRAEWGGLWGRSLHEKRTRMFNEGLRPPDGHLPLESALTTPLLHHDELVGQFLVANKPGGYDEYDVELLESAAAQTAPVLSGLLMQGRQRRKHEELEHQYRQAQKMEAVGQLAGGVAHDFNNMLQVISGNGEIALLQTEEDSAVRESLREMLKAADRAAKLVRQLLAFSRRQMLEIKDVDLNDVIAELAKLSRRVIGEDITLDFVPQHDLGIVRADAGQIGQILMNLWVNARDAMPRGGTITVQTENVRIDEAFCESHYWALPGRYVLVSVTDTGSGMDEKTLANVFDPFFTTKEVGEGTGLGLAMVYGAVKQHKGMILAHSELGKGTTFEIYLPVAEGSSADVGDKIESQRLGGSETILLAEDEEMVLNLAKVFLEDAGYTVLPAADGEEAWTVFDEHGDAIDLAVLDVVMPKLGGRALLERIRTKRAQMPVLMTSGYSLDAIHSGFVLDEGLAFIQKPYQRTELLRNVRDVLDHR